MLLTVNGDSIMQTQYKYDPVDNILGLTNVITPKVPTIPPPPSQIGHERYTYDANGNPTLVEDDSLNTERRMAWDEENRLMALSDNGK